MVALMRAVTAITAAPVHAAVVYAESAGNRWPAAVPADSTRPPTALPTDRPTLRTTRLKLIALDVSLSGVTARMTAGMAAEKAPTPAPRIAIASSGPAMVERAIAKSAKAPSTTIALPASTRRAPSRARRDGVTRPPRKPSREKGTRTRPASNVVSPKP
jgi:hypothetical protein